MTDAGLAVWRLDLGAPHEPNWRLLDARERAAADAFVQAEDRMRYGHAHCALRILLGDLLGIAPAQVAIRVGETGKPFLDGPGGEVTFNLSHSRHTALIAIARGAAVGVDVEDDDGRSDYGEMIGTVFDDAAAAMLRQLAPPRQRQVFLRGWTRKEAVAKALGSGFLIDPRRFAVPLDSAGPWTVQLPDIAGTKLGLADLSEKAFVAAVAAEGLHQRPEVRQFVP